MGTTAINNASNWIGYKGPDNINLKNDNDDFSVWDSVKGPFYTTEEQKKEFELNLENYRAENGEQPYPPHIITIRDPQDVDFFNDEDCAIKEGILM